MLLIPSIFNKLTATWSESEQKNSHLEQVSSIIHSTIIVLCPNRSQSKDLRTHLPSLNLWINPRFVQVSTYTSSINLIQARGEHSSLFLLNLPCDWSLCCLYPYTDLLLAARQQPVSVSIKLGVEDNPSTFLEPVWTQCQHLQYKSSWDVFDHTGGALELDLLHHWTTASEACPKCKEIALWGHFASISPFGSVPLCLHIHWVREHENNSLVKGSGQLPERGNTWVPAWTEALQQSGTVSAGATSHLQPHSTRRPAQPKSHIIWGGQTRHLG